MAASIFCIDAASLQDAASHPDPQDERAMDTSTRSTSPPPPPATTSANSTSGREGGGGDGPSSAQRHPKKVLRVPSGLMDSLVDKANQNLLEKVGPEGIEQLSRAVGKGEFSLDDIQKHLFEGKRGSPGDIGALWKDYVTAQG